MPDEIKPGVEGTPEGEPKSAMEEKKFSQTDLNKFLAEDRRKNEERNKARIAELEALKESDNLTKQQKADLETRIEEMRNEFLTKEELAKKREEALLTKSKTELEKSNTERDHWRTKYTNAEISRSLSDAAMANKAINPAQVDAILRPATRIKPVLGDDDKPTGEYAVVVAIPTKDDTGKSVTLELSPDEAVKRLAADGAYANLFRAEGSGGSGGYNNPGGKPADQMALFKNPAAYRKAVREGKI